MAKQIVPKPEVADDLSKLLASLRKSAEAADTDPGADTPDEDEARELGKESGSTVDQADLQAADLGNDNALETTEIGDDPAAVEEDVTVTEKTSDGEAEIEDSGEGLLEKQASALADELEKLDAKLLHLAAVEVVSELAIRHQAEMEEQAVEEAMVQAIPEIQEALGVNDETAAAVAEGILSGQVTEEDWADAVQQTADLQDIVDSTDADPEEVMAFAQAVEQEAEATGKPVEEILESTLSGMQDQAMQGLEQEYNASDTIAKTASAEGNAFAAAAARRNMRRIERILDSMYGVGSVRKRAEEEMAEEETPAEETPVEETPAAEVVPETATETADADGADAAAAAGAEEAAAGMAEGATPDDMQVQIVQDAIQALIDEGVDPAVIAQAVQERTMGVLPDLTKVASAEDLEKNPKLMTHVALAMAVNKAVGLKR